MGIVEKVRNSKLLDSANGIKTIDMHTAGEPLRVIIDGFAPIKGETILQKRKYVKENLDHLRTALMYEPRGHADMYGVLVVEPENKNSDFGVIFMHNEGYSTMCGHATIAISKLAVKLQWVQVTKPITKIKIDAPCGVLESFVTIDENDIIVDISFHCVPSFVVALDEEVLVEGIGEVRYDLAYGGAFYAYVDADSINLSLDKENYSQIINYGKQIKQVIMHSKQNIKHPFEDDLSFLYGVIFITNSSKHHSKNVCVFADGEVDRSPTGSGVSGRAAIHHKKGELEVGESICIESIIDTTFKVKIEKTLKFGNYESLIPKVSGDAFITGTHTFYIDEKDELKYGFFLR